MTAGSLAPTSPLASSARAAHLTTLRTPPIKKMTPVKGPSDFLVVPVVTVTFDDGYAVATVFPPAMPATVMNAVLCARTSIFAIVTTIVAAIAIISVIAHVNANALGAHNARRCYRENSSTNKSNFLHSYLQIKARTLNGTHGKPFRDLLPLFPERMFILRRQDLTGAFVPC
jgi:hypothetical protein